MTKTYTVPCNTKYAFVGETSSSVAYRSSEPDAYYVGQSSKRYAIHCLFEELADIQADAVTAVSVSVQRIEGGSPISYSVNLNGTIPTEAVDSTLRSSSESITANLTAMNWEGNSSDVGGEYRTFSLDADQFSNLATYGFVYLWGSSERIISVDDVYLTVTTSETDFTLSYDANGGTGRPASQTIAGVGEATFTVTTTEPTQTGYTFLGWAETATATVAQYQAGDSITVTEDTTLYAVWEAKEYTVTFDPNGGTVEPSTKTVTYGEPYGTFPEALRAGYRVSGWYQSNGTCITEDTIVTTASNHTLTAEWEQQSVIHFMGEQGVQNGILYVKQADALKVGVLYVMGSDGKLHISG